MPASKTWFTNPDGSKDRKWYESYCVNNKIHRKPHLGPAHQKWFKNGQKHSESYYVNDEPHREPHLDPVIQKWHSDGRLYHESYCVKSITEHLNKKGDEMMLTSTATLLFLILVSAGMTFTIAASALPGWWQVRNWLSRIEFFETLFSCSFYTGFWASCLVFGLYGYFAGWPFNLPYTIFFGFAGAYTSSVLTWFLQE